MPQTLEALERQRTKLYEHLKAVGDFRPGTISVNFRKCGKTNCACVRKGHKGHGPQYLWNTTAGGQSRAQSLRMGAELEKVRKELAAHRAFLGLCRQLVGPVSGIRNPSATDCQAPKKTLSLCSSVPSLLRSHTLLSRRCNLNCGIWVDWCSTEQ